MLDREIIEIFIDGKVHVFQIAYDCKKIGLELMSSTIELRKILTTSFWRKVAIEQKNNTQLHIVVCINDTKIPYDIQIATKTLNDEQEIEKELETKIAEVTRQIAYRLAYELIISTAFAEQDQE